MEEENIVIVNEFEHSEPDLLNYKGVLVISPDHSIEYWKQRCMMAENIIREILYDPNMTENQRLNWIQYKEYLKQNSGLYNV